MIGVFLQARLSSVRLPRKVLLPLGGKPLIAWAMERLRKVPADYYVLATDYASADELWPVALDCGFVVFSGSTDDVLGRFVRAAQVYEVDTIIRATGDNPLVDDVAATMILDEHLRAGADFSAYQGLPRGRGVEVVQASALYEADKAADSYEREHVTPYIYRRPERFKLHKPFAPMSFCGGFDVTVDTLEEYEAVSRLFN